MKSAGYESIPSSGDDNSTFFAGRKSSWKVIIAALLIAVVAFFGLMKSGEDSETPSLAYYPVEAMSEDPVEDPGSQNWPNHLVSQAGMNTPRPTNTAEAVEKLWEKSGEPCVPSLGEPWLYKGQRSSETSATLYFTPQVGDVPGILSGIEVDYYGYIETNLIGSYFSEERTAEDGTYHSLAVAFRNSAQQDLCDSVTPTKQDGEKYIAISPDLINKPLPVKSTLSELTSKWKEGSCIPNMGYHWWQDTEGGTDLSYKAETTVPISPMYSSTDGTINGLLFLATAKKQNWGDTCSFPPTRDCVEKLNFWDAGPGLSQANEGFFYFCSNFCGKCEFTGSGSNPGLYTTMHWFFTDTKVEKCDGTDMGRMPYCPEGSYPKDFNH